MKPSLLLLAAGMGSRYGGLKQLDSVGPHGETIMDYSIYDAIHAGFGKVVFVIRKDFEGDFRQRVLCKYENVIDTAVVFQSLDSLPAGFTVPVGREKPWGTNHAVMVARDVINEPFCAINCDDFYGRDAFKVMSNYLSSLEEDAQGRYAMAGYRVCNTLSSNGSVSRGVCTTDAAGKLVSIVERTKIMRKNGHVCYYDDAGDWTILHEHTPVSMNFWGFTPDYFDYSEEAFRRFLSASSTQENAKAEFYIPFVVNEMINNGVATVQVLDTDSAWFGVTYAEDRPSTVANIALLTKAGEYPSKLF